jgi:hypothetical protein
MYQVVDIHFKGKGKNQQRLLVQNWDLGVKKSHTPMAIEAKKVIRHQKSDN